MFFTFTEYVYIFHIEFQIYQIFHDFFHGSFLPCLSHSLNIRKAFTSRRQRVMQLQLQQKLFQVPSFILVNCLNIMEYVCMNDECMKWRIGILEVFDLIFWMFSCECLKLGLTYLDLDFHLWPDMHYSSESIEFCWLEGLGLAMAPGSQGRYYWMTCGKGLQHFILA